MLKANELVSYLTEEGFDPDFAEDGEEIIFCCPLCDDDRSRLYVNTQTGGWKCFHCDEHGNLHQLLINVVGLNGSQAFSLRDRVWENGDYDVDVIIKRREQMETVSNIPLHLPSDMEPIDQNTPQRYLNYLVKRHVSPELAATMGIGFVADGYWGRRIIVPVESDKHLYTFIARTLMTKCPNCDEVLNACTCRPFKYPKVLTPTKKRGAQPRLTLFNLDTLRNGNAGRLVITEGVFDALRLPNEAVATLGASASPTQITLLAGIARGRDTIVAYDPDQAGYTGALNVAKALSSMLVPVRVAVLPEGEDCGSIDRTLLEKCLKRARRFVL